MQTSKLVWDYNFAKCHCGIETRGIKGVEKTVEELTVIGEHPLWQWNANQAMRLTTTDAYYSVGEKRATLWKIFPFVSSTSFWIALVDCCSDGVIARASKQQLSHSYLYHPSVSSNWKMWQKNYLCTKKLGETESRVGWMK